MNWVRSEERLPVTDKWLTTFLVTVECDSWREPETMAMDWENTTVRGKKVSRWKFRDYLVKPEWRVVAWADLPAPYKEGKKSEAECERNVCTTNEYNGATCEECPCFNP